MLCGKGFQQQQVATYNNATLQRIAFKMEADRQRVFVETRKATDGADIRRLLLQQCHNSISFAVLHFQLLFVFLRLQLGVVLLVSATRMQ